MAQTRKPSSTLRDINRFAELLSLSGKRERYIYTAAVEQRPLGSNNVKTLRKARDVIAAGMDLLPGHEPELLAADKVIVEYMPDEEKKSTGKRAAKAKA